MENNEMEVSLLDIWEIFKKNWLTYLLIVIIFASSAFVFTKFFVDKTYTAEAKIIIVQQKDSALNQSVNINDINLSQKLVSTYTQVMRSEAITDLVVANLDLDFTNKQVNDVVSISNANGTEVMNISATTKDPILSAAIANEMVTVFRSEIFDIMQIENVTVLNPAKVPTVPSGPKTMQNTLLAAMLGAVVSGLILVIQMLKDTKVKNEEELKNIFNYPIIGTIPNYELFDEGGTI